MGSITPLLKDNKMAKPDWIIVNPSSGEGTGSFNVTCAENTSTSARSGVITVRTLGGLTREIQVSQAGKIANSIQGSGDFCAIGIPSSVFPVGVSQVTFNISIHLTNNTWVYGNSPTTITKDEGQEYSIGVLSLNSEKKSVASGVAVNAIRIACSPGAEEGTPFDYCTGEIDNPPADMSFGMMNSTGKSSASFVQINNYTIGFDLSTAVPISGKATFVYKGSPDDLPSIIINRLA